MDFYAQEVAVIAPRFRIAWVMVAVAIVALDFWVIRALLGPHTSVIGHQRDMFLLLGALPMANVLTVGMLAAQRRPGCRPFLMGFEMFGGMALALFIALATCFPREVVMPYLTPFLAPVEMFIGPGRPFVYIPIGGLVVAVMLVGPQVVFALVGGVLSRKFKVTITPR
jgi:hypothetical protein